MRVESMKRRVAVVAAAGLFSTIAGASLGLAPAVAAVPAAQSTSAFCAGVPASFGGFTDIAETIHRKTIECLAYSEITQGKTATTFAPRLVVTRGQMASFIARAIDKANELEKIELVSLPANPPNQFTDDDGSVHEANINRLAAAGVVRGTSATTFAPGVPVRRDQMATFINNAQKFLSGGVAFTTNDDFFVDDENNLHEANINGIASVGITAGVDATHYQPSSPVLRANMATFVTRYLAVLHKAGAVYPLLPPSNATLAFTPTSAERRTAATEPSTTDERTYTATGLGTGPYRVTLFQSSLVTIPNNQYTFTEDGSTNLASAGTVGGQIVNVKGQAVTPAPSIGAITPTNGTITVIVDAVDYSKLLPIIYTDQGGDNTRLNLDAQNRPTEPFGVGGELETLPVLAATTATFGQDATVLMADEVANLLVGRIGSTQHTYLYDTNDTFYRDSVGAENALTLAQFEAALSKDDLLDGTTSYQSSSGLSSVFVLENVSPPTPTAEDESVGETTAVITVTNLTAGATAKVYLAADGVNFTAATPLKTSSSTDADAATLLFQVNLTGLTPNTYYEFYVTQTVDGEESDPHTKVAGDTSNLRTAAIGPPTVTSASLKPDQPDRNVLVLKFSEDITPITPFVGSNPKVTVSCTVLEVPSSSTSGSAVEQPAGSGDTIEVTLVDDVPENPLASCTASVVKDVVKDGTGTPNAAQSGIAVS
jgi:hypothetical protein